MKGPSHCLNRQLSSDILHMIGPLDPLALTEVDDFMTETWRLPERRVGGVAALTQRAAAASSGLRMAVSRVWVRGPLPATDWRTVSDCASGAPVRALTVLWQC
jgi:hypothetical protein